MSVNRDPGYEPREADNVPDDIPCEVRVVLIPEPHGAIVSEPMVMRCTKLWCHVEPHDFTAETVDGDRVRLNMWHTPKGWVPPDDDEPF